MFPLIYIVSRLFLVSAVFSLALFVCCVLKLKVRVVLFHNFLSGIGREHLSRGLRPKMALNEILQRDSSSHKGNRCAFPPTTWINFYGDEFRLKFDSRRHPRAENREASAVLRNQLSLSKNSRIFIRLHANVAWISFAPPNPPVENCTKENF